MGDKVSLFDPKQDAAALKDVIDYFLNRLHGETIPAISAMLDEKIERLERLTVTNVTNISERPKT